jgi:hypothetical protein
MQTSAVDGTHLATWVTSATWKYHFHWHMRQTQCWHLCDVPDPGGQASYGVAS